MSDAILTASGISKNYRRGSETVKALNNVDFCLGRGEFLAIVGPSGSGKSTLLHLLGLLDTPSTGEISIGGRQTRGMKEHQLVKIRRKAIGFVFQQFLLLPTLTVRENIELPLMFSGKTVKPGRISDIIESLGLTGRAGHLPHQLSGGEMQRVSIGRSLVNDPEVLMADEPTGNLDTANSGIIFDLFRQLNRKGLSLIIVTHNIELAGMADRAIRLKDGEITAA